MKEKDLKPTSSYIKSLVDQKEITEEFGLIMLRALKKEKDISIRIAKEYVRAKIYNIVVRSDMDREELKKEILNIEFDEAEELN
jgi:hypothetical protein